MKKGIFWILLLVFLAYLGFKFGVPYYRYLAFKADTKEIVKISIDVKDDEKIRNKIFERAQELKVPIEKDDIEISRTERVLRVRISWFEVVDIYGIYQKTLTFSIDTEV
jgi:predicted membrane protein